MNAGVTVNPATLPNGTVGVSYSQTVSATGGNGSYTFSVSAGSLPAGLSLNAATGAITGTPTTAATSNFTITATDGLGATGARAYSVTINAAITVNPATLPNGTLGTAYAQTVSATGGNGSYTFSVSAGSCRRGFAERGHGRDHRDTNDNCYQQLHRYRYRRSGGDRRACVQRHN